MSAPRANTAWAPLLPVAMVGSDRHAQPWPVWPGEIGALLAQIGPPSGAPSSTPPLAVLRAAAILATCERAGAQGMAWAEALPVAAAADSAPALPDGPVTAAVTWALQDGPARLQQEVLIALARAGRRLPAALLPTALDLGRRSIALRTQLHPVLGARGLWLAAQREEWRYAAGVAEDEADGSDSALERVWLEGGLEQRRAGLERERRTAPAAARVRLEQSLADLPAKERAELAGALKESLSPDDEALLDRLAADRSREVRQVAGALLMRLPQSAFAQRAATRVEALLRQERVLLRKRWAIDAPEAFGDDWKADGLDPVRPKHESLGERAWWLFECVRRVPLGWWTQHTGLSPAELRRWAADTDWAEALLRGWHEVLLAAPDPAWCEAFLDDWPGRLLRDSPAMVLALLPPAARERHWLRQLQTADAAFNGIAGQALAACPPGETLSAALAAPLVDRICERAHGRTLRDDYALRAALPELCAVLPIDTLARLAQIAPHDDDTASIADTLRTVAQVIGVRQALQSLQSR